MNIVWNEEKAIIGADGDWETVSLAEALESVKNGELYECEICEMDGQYDDGLRTFHPTSQRLSSGETQERHEQAKEN